jgi:predicted RNA-binding protein YlqC (UPF0109 family)
VSDLADDDLEGDVEPALDADADGGDTDSIAEGVLTYLVAALVDDPSAVTVDSHETRRGSSLEVRVAPGDLGRVIGRRGRTAQSIRAVVRAAAARDGAEVDVDFVD